MADRRQSCRFLLALLVPAALWGTFWWPQISGELVLFMRDLTMFALPAKHFLMQRLAEGDVPHWNPLFSAGLPFLADPANQTFYPMHLLLLGAVDLPTGITRFLVAHLLIGMLGCASLARVSGASVAASAWVGCIYGVAGYTVSITDNVTYVSGIAWAPVALAAWVAARRTRTLPGLMLAGGALAMLLLAGNVLDAAVTGVTMLLLGLVAREDNGPQRLATAGGRWSLLPSLLMVPLVAGALAAVQVLPTLEMMALSVRSEGIGYAEQVRWSFPPQRTLELVQPFFFGSVYPVFDFLSPHLYPHMTTPWADSVYLGLLPVALAMAGLFARPRPSLAWWMLAGFALLFSFGGHVGGFRWLLEHVPVLGTQRYPEKLLAWVTLALMVPAAHGADALRRGGPPFARLLDASTFVRCVLSLSALAVLFALLLDAPARALIWDYAQRYSLLWSTRVGYEVTHLQGLLLHALPIALAMLAILWSARRQLAMTALLVMAVAVADLTWVHWRHTPGVPPAATVIGQPLALQMMQADGMPVRPRVYFDEEAPGQDVRFRNSRIAQRLVPVLGAGVQGRVRGYLLAYAMQFQQERLSTQAGILWSVGYLNGRYSPLQPSSHFKLEQALFAGDADRLLARSATQFVITSIEPRNLAWDQPGLREVARDDDLNLRLLRVLDAQPFARLAAGVWPSAGGAADPDEWLELDARIPGAVLVSAAQGLQPLSAPGPTAAVTATRRPRAEVIEVDVHGLDADALLVVAESAFPGWAAEVDGRATMTVVVDGRQIGVPLTAGARRVVLVYTTPRLWLGAGISALALAGVVLVLMSSGRSGWGRLDARHAASMR